MAGDKDRKKRKVESVQDSSTGVSRPPIAQPGGSGPSKAAPAGGSQEGEGPGKTGGAKFSWRTAGENARKFLSGVLSPITPSSKKRAPLSGKGATETGTPGNPRAQEARDAREKLNIAELNQKRSRVLGDDINERVQRFYTDGVMDRRDDWLSSIVPGSKNFRDTKAAQVTGDLLGEGAYAQRRAELQRAFLAGLGDPTLARGSAARAEAVRKANSVAYRERLQAEKERADAYWEHWKQQNAERRAARAGQQKDSPSGQAEKKSDAQSRPHMMTLYFGNAYRKPGVTGRVRWWRPTPLPDLIPPVRPTPSDKGSPKSRPAGGPPPAGPTGDARSGTAAPLTPPADAPQLAPPPPPGPSEDETKYSKQSAYGGGETFGTYRVNSDGRHSRQGLSVDKLALLRASFGYA